jgi:rhodanese-related sulfurtransferase
MTTQTIPPQALAQIAANGDILLVDVRTPGEYASVHVEPSLLLPLDRFTAEALPVNGEAQARTVYLICGRDVRARQAADRIAGDARFAPVVVEGGINAWLAAGLPVARGRGAIALERQVRIAAGSLVVIGVGLGWLVHPGCNALAGFVGAGLVFAGITDTCGMALLLARLPWNRTATSDGCASTPAR